MRWADQRAMRALAGAASLATGWSRLNDRMHYPSQILLGYSIAWTAVDAVKRSEDEMAKKAAAATATAAKPESDAGGRPAAT
jgi:hypothetical protein